MVERIVEKTVRVYIPRETFQEYAEYPADSPTVYIRDYAAGQVTRVLLEKGYIKPGESLNVVFVPDDEMDPDSKARRIKLIRSEKDRKGGYVSNANVKRRFIEIFFHENN